MNNRYRITNHIARSIALALLISGFIVPSLALPQHAAAQFTDLEAAGTGATLPGGGANASPEAKALQEETAKAEAALKTESNYDPTQRSCVVTDVQCGILKLLNFIMDTISEIPFRAGTAFLYSMLAFNMNAFGGESAEQGTAQNRIILDVTRLGWNIVLGVVNMFFVLFLLWIAIATIFDLEMFTARKLLGKLIIAALLINFSFAIGTAVINLGNGIGAIFFRAIESRGGFQNATRDIFNHRDIVQRIINQTSISEEDARRMLTSQTITVPAFFGATNVTLNADECHNIIAKRRERSLSAILKNIAATAAIYPLCEQLLGKQDVANAVNRVYPEDRANRLMAIALVAKIFLVPVSLFVIFAAGIFLLIRLISLMLLLIFGPLAFLGLFVPHMGEYWSGWWSRLFKWSFYLPAFLFLFMLSAMLIQGIGPLAGKVIVNGKEQVPELLLIVTYFMGLALMIASLMVANQMSIQFAGTVTGWGKSMSKGVGKYVGGRGWKYGGRGTEAVMGTGVMRALGRIPIIGTATRAAATAVMKKGVGVEKKDIEFYSKLPDRQLATVLSTMREGRARALWAALPPKRKREARPELAALARSRGWTEAPPEPTPPPTPQQTQNLQNQILPIIQSMNAFMNLPQNIQQAVTQGMQQTIQNLPAGVTPQAATQSIIQAAQQTAVQQAASPIAVNLANNFSTALQNQATQIQNAAQAVIPPPPRPARPTLREDLEAEIEDLRGEIEDLRASRT